MKEILLTRSVLNLTGPNTLDFLQNITTNDLINNHYSYNYLLSPGGRYLYDFFVAKIDDTNFFIDVDSNSSHSLIQRLNLYKIRKEVTIEDQSEKYDVIYSNSSLDHNDVVFSYRDTRFYKLGFRSLVPKNSINIKNESLNLYLQDKYEWAIPDGADDLIKDRSIPSNFGAEELSAVSFSKGCYVGQEVISRAKYQGVIRKKIFKIISSEKILGDLKYEVTDIDGNKLGNICSSYNNKAIALLNEEKCLGLEEKMVIIGGNTKAEFFIPEWRLSK